jgi:hypothetical protein
MSASSRSKKRPLSRITRIVGAALVMTLVTTPVALAQEDPQPQVLVNEIENGFILAPEMKFSEVNGKFAHFFGGYGGWLINHRVLIGGGGYGLTNRYRELDMGYGGFVIEYFANPTRLVNFSVKGLVGAGSSSYHWDDPFFVVEPEAQMTLNVAEHFRIGFGGGYRFIEAAGRREDDLDGFAFKLDFKFGIF